MDLSNIKIWIQSARPKTLPAAIGPVLIGAALASSDGDIHTPTLILTFLAAMLIQIGTNYANDYYDFVKGTDTADRVGPLRATQAGLVTPRQMKLAFIIVFALAAVCGALLVLRGGMPIATIGIASILCGIMYTAGPVSLAQTGLADFFVLVFFGPVAVGGTYYLQTGDFNRHVLIAGLAPGLLSMAILTVNNIRDIHTDCIAGRKTLAVRFGCNFGIAEFIFCIVLACTVPIYLTATRSANYYCNISLLSLIFAISPIKTILAKPEPQILNKVLAQTGRLLIIYSILFSIGWLI